jgi:Tfp pilus assembly protein PilZ
LLSDESIDAEIFPTLGAWRSSESVAKINGIIIDFRILMASDEENRKWFDQIKTVFPVLLLFPAKNEMGFRLTYHDFSIDSVEQLKGGVKQTFKAYSAQSVRRHIRYDRYYRVEAIKTNKNLTIQSFVSNISLGGLYLVLLDADQHFAVGNQIEIKFVDVLASDRKKKVSVHGQIRFIRSWINARIQEPGIGVMVDAEDLQYLKDLVQNSLKIG